MSWLNTQHSHVSYDSCNTVNEFFPWKLNALFLFHFVSYLSKILIKIKFQYFSDILLSQNNSHDCADFKKPENILAQQGVLLLWEFQKHNLLFIYKKKSMGPAFLSPFSFVM